MSTLLFVVGGAAFVALFGVTKWKQFRAIERRNERVRTDVARTDYPFSYRLADDSLTISETSFWFRKNPNPIPYDSVFYVSRVFIDENKVVWRVRYDPTADDARLEWRQVSEDTEVAARVLAQKAGVEIDEVTETKGFSLELEG